MMTQAKVCNLDLILNRLLGTKTPSAVKIKSDPDTDSNPFPDSARRSGSGFSSADPVPDSALQI